MALIIKNGRIIDPSGNLDGQMDILVSGGKITKISGNINLKKQEESRRVIDAKGLLVVPGLIDIHTHLREPGREDEETIETASSAAVWGGFTSIVAMPNTDPVNDNRSITEFILKKGREACLANVFAMGSITKSMKGEQLSDIGEMAESGCLGFTEDGKSVMDSGLLRRAMEYMKMFNLPAMSHCEDTTLSREGVMHEGFMSTELGLGGIPRESEEIIVSRDIAISQMTGARLHITHVSSAGTVEIVRQAKKKGINVTADATPHHFTLTAESLKDYDTNLKMKPPLREKSDIKAIIKGFRDGTIDAIGTDHAPHYSAEKDVEFNIAPFGIIGLQTALSLALKLYHSKQLSLNQVIKLMSCSPAQILGLKNKGTLIEGSDADITIIDPEFEYRFEEKDIKSLSRNSPFIKWTFKGKAVMTIVAGKIAYSHPQC